MITFNISHELRTPITLIIGPLEQVLKSANDGLNPAIKSNLELVRKNTNTLKILVDDILDLSKLQNHKMVLHTETLNLQSFLEQKLNNFKILAEQKSIKLNLRFINLKDRNVLIDPVKIEKVINNLLSNALKFTDFSGLVSFSAIYEDQKLILEITDNGCCISSDEISQIFDRYYQTEQAEKRSASTGIGLALTKELINLMKGTVNVSSKLNEGTCFKLEIPAPLSEINPELKEHKTSNNEQLISEIDLKNLFLQDHKQSKKYTVLIVEDHADMQIFIFGLLNTHYNVIKAENGKKAIEILKVSEIELIISDIMMPEMDGYELLETLKDDEQYRNIPVIMLTALKENDNYLKALYLGVADYLSKPFSAEELMARSHNLIERYQVRKEAIEEELFDKKVSFSSELDSSKKQIRDLDLELMDKVEKIIRKNIENQDFNLANLSDQLCLSNRQLRRKIKRITGMNPKKYQQEIQLLFARELLEMQKCSNVKAVALSVGISHVTRFSQFYEARFGKHPSDYFYSRVDKNLHPALFIGLDIHTEKVN